MNRLVAVLALGGAILAAGAGRADEPSPLEFVRGLRARHYPDLALEYLERIRPAAPPELAAGIALEIARTRLEIAKAQPDSAVRLQKYGEARRDFEAFLQKHGDSPEAGDAKLEIAGIAVLQSKAQLDKALRPPVHAAQLKEARKALEDAAAQLGKVAKELEARADKLADAKTPKEQAEKKALEEARWRADLEQGINLLDQARTYLDDGKTDVVKERGDKVRDARRFLDRAAGTADPKSPVYWQAQAWVGKALQELGDPAQARAQLERIMSQKPVRENSPGLEAGQRLALYFLLQVAPEAPAGKKDPTREQQELAEEWLRRFGAAAETAEGHTVRWQLAQAYINQARDPARKDKGKPLYDKAAELLRKLEQGDHEYAERAQQERANILFTLGGGEKGDISKFTSFEQCFIRARYEAAQWGAESAKIKEPEAFQKQRQARFAAMTAALQRGLKLVEEKKSKAPEADLSAALSMLVYARLVTGELKEAIRLGAQAVRDKPDAPQARNIAAYVLQAYGQALGNPDAAKLSLEEEDEYREQLRDFARFVAGRWPDDLAADVAHFQTGLVYIKDKKYPESIDELEKVRPGHPAAIHARLQLALAAFQVAKDKAAEREKAAGADKARLEKEEQAYKDRAVKALETLPELPPGADAGTNQAYVEARLRYGAHLYTQKKYDDMDRLTGPLLKQLPDLGLESEQVRDDLRTRLVLLRLYAVLGRADAAFAKGDYAKARAALDDVVSQARADKLPELKKDPQLRWGLLSMALRANIQDGNLPRAQEVLQVMQAAGPEDARQGGLTAVLFGLTPVIEGQLKDARKRGDKAQVEKTTAGFAAFLDDLRQKQKDQPPEFRLLLAQGYAAVERYDTALDALGKPEEPAGKEGKELDRARQVYRASRVLHARLLRQAGKLDEAEKEVKAILDSPDGKTNIEALKERVHLLDVRKHHGQAATEWNKLASELRKKMNVPELKAQYFECYYHLTESYYRYGLSLSDPKKRAKAIQMAAGFISKLEDAWPDLGGETSKARFQELLDSEKELKDEYLKLRPANH